jgi:hypothetical protein
MIISTKGFFFPWVATGQPAYDAVAMCHTVGFVTYSEVENANFRSGSYLISESDQHYLKISGYLEDYYNDPIAEWGGRTVAQQLLLLAPRHDTLYEFELTLTNADPETGPSLMKRYIDTMTRACSALFDLDLDGNKTALLLNTQET